ncbi:MAG: hypothetical protein RMK57_07745 [Bryobacterales bacterium]|nr:hypothetical protein [Bryobacteraceae bacterium]MDW8354408.1 hypothetical protein [Bryobacterales bacterium]
MAPKLLSSIVLFGAAILVPAVDAIPVLVAAVIAAALLRAGLARRRQELVLLGVPLAWFLLLLAVLQWLARKPDPALLLKACGVLLLATSAARVFPWQAVTARLVPASRLFRPALFLLFLRHFMLTLAHETLRTLRARSMSAPHLLRPGGFGSLVWASVAIFRRALERAERFYAAQVLNGLGP